MDIETHTFGPYIPWNNFPLEKIPRQNLELNSGPFDQ